MRIAHLSDVHVVAPSSARRGYALRTRAVNFGRAASASQRRATLERALAAVKRSSAEHLVISGDLTDLGDDAELALFGEILGASGLDPAMVTLIPGNHDAYSTPDGYARALRGPLAPWAAGSARPGEVRAVERGAVVFVPLDVTRHQSIVFSGGLIDATTAAALDRIASDPAHSTKCLVVVLHHPPFHRHDHPVGRYVDSLRGIEHVNALMERHPSMHLLHGHFHQALDRPRIFGAPGTSDDGEAPRVRIYDVVDTALVPGGFIAA